VTALIAAWWAGLRWRLGRPAIRRRLRDTLAVYGGAAVDVRELVDAAHLGDVPPRAVDAALTDLVNAGRADGLRGLDGWLEVRALPPFALAPVEGIPAPMPARSRTRPATSGSRSAFAALFRRTQAGAAGTPDAESPFGVPGSGAATAATPAAVWPVPAARDFSVMTRLPARRARGFSAGILLFVVAAAIAAVGARVVIQGGARSQEPTAPTTRAEWYHAVAQAYVDAHLAGHPGYGWPYRFAEIGGVPETAPRDALVQGMEQYIRGALYTGYPSEAGILMWARSEFGEMPAGPAGDAYLHRVAAAYATRSLAGTPGYELTPAIRAYGNIDPNTRDPQAVTAGVERALRAALYLGTPDVGGVLDWARRTFGDLPAAEQPG
jgi:hypothetical protein